MASRRAKSARIPNEDAAQGAGGMELVRALSWFGFGEAGEEE